MVSVVDLVRADDLQSMHDEASEFKHHVQVGLAKENKQLQSKYFYDERGSQLFNKITRHPDYYLTKCEMEIVNTHKKDIAQQMGDEAFNLIELGPGEGIKTQLLLEEFLAAKLHFTYMPIDISINYLQTLRNKFKKTMPDLKLRPIHSDYFQGLEWLGEHSSKRKLVLFLGSSIGNLNAIATGEFLQHLHAVLHPGDYVCIGFDLRKDIHILMRAYDDNEGITRDFNLNLLERINRELGANFNISKFRHYATYNVHSGAMESYLVSLEKQQVMIPALNQSYVFELAEAIHTEYSYKYSLSQVTMLARDNGFNVLRNFTDTRQYFVDTLWRVENK